MKLIRYYFSIMILCTISTLALGQQFFGDQEEIDKILVNVDKFSSYVMGSDYDNIANCYTKDGKIFPNNRDIIEGRSLIKAYWQLPADVSIVYHKVTPSEIKIIGDEAYDYGRYEGRTNGKDGNEVSWKGKYVIVWKKVDNEWKIYLDIWNRIADKT